jgi:RNA polymerase sigma factor (sigma-70 family)
MRSDADLLAAAASDPAPFRELYDRYAARLYAYHRRRTGADDAAHDLTAETFAQAWLCRRRFRDEAGGSAGPWLFAIARHVLLESVRRRQLERRACERLGLASALERATGAAPPDERWLADLDGVDDLLATLPRAQRDAIRLRVVDDLGYEDVARSLATTPAAARVRVHRGLATLRSTLADSRERLP